MSHPAARGCRNKILHMNITPIVLCGGSGTRLWPLSRTGFPKQFLAITGRDSLFQLAAARLGGMSAPDLRVAGPLVVSNEEHRFLMLDQLAGLKLPPAGVLPTWPSDRT